MQIRTPATGITFWYSLVLLFCALVLAAEVSASDNSKPKEPSIEEMFAAAPFDKWAAEAPHQDIPWKIHTFPGRLSIHQRLIARIEVELRGAELVRRQKDGDILLLVQVSDPEGRDHRNFGVLDLANMKPETRKADVAFSWEAFALPGDYKLAVALYDKASGEHNFMRSNFRVEKLKNDLLPEAWNRIPAWEFWGPVTDGPDSVYRSDIESKLFLPLATKRSLRLQVLADLTPSDLFHGSYALYEGYLSGVLPLFKLFSHLNVENGSLSAASLDLIRRKVPFTQDNVRELDWKRLGATLSFANGPGVVDVKGLKKGQQSPAFLREEVMRRLEPHETNSEQAAASPRTVFIIIGSPMDSYSFPEMAPMEITPEEESDAVIYYLQFFPAAHVRNGDPISTGRPHYRSPFDPANDPTMHRGRHAMPTGIVGAAGKVEKLLKPLRVHTFEIHTAEDARHALARIMEEVSRW